MDEKRTVIALAGNPNVGKSTIFNGLTGLRQHTGNWSGVTVTAASGAFEADGKNYLLVDLPGIYSLDSRAGEEEVARDFLCSGLARMAIVVCDATCLERGLYLLRQILSLDYVKDMGMPVILCVNLWDEARRKGIEIDFSLLRDVLQIPVAPICARSRKDLKELKQLILDSDGQRFSYDCLDFSPKQLAQEAVLWPEANYRKREEILDRLLTGPVTGILIMLLLLFGVFWISMAGANYPSALLWNLLFSMEEKLASLLRLLGASPVSIDCLVYGIYRVLAWVVSVMLPPMAIFFPLFTLLEDLGYLPRAAFNMDRAFQKCRACGKQCLTMAMGLGCNAAGVIGCRIIDSPRERLLAILTNAFVPCNGRLPTLFTMISLFFIMAGAGSSLSPAGTSAADFSGFAGSSLAAALLLTLVLIIGVLMTLGVSWLLSHTLLRGIPSAFTLELPPYRRPQVGRILVRSVFDRTLFVLGRAAAVAAPAGFIIWILANISFTGPLNGWFAAAGPNTPSLLSGLTGFLDPLGRLMGLDGVILAAFILGFPANEIVLPIILMAYLQTGRLVQMEELSSLSAIFLEHGWTPSTPLCLMIFCLFHWPCSTTCLTIRRETGSLKWTAAAILLPTAAGVILCTAANALCSLITVTF
ncbi:MAG TPA: ferrous iron transporter B [Candidatus Lachnoclostridium stercorigallinarum]|mgnify:FL=1|uniref:Ferrous iron transporter B n=1 Tax=Candidatus Lachnoclostridium stercorigallinarum TaxID=2838634 RepID=A0A9D2GFN6_9FIRM|nr:ferrous iron transporter B [Candidatus Lachnoclostridium stercorigallinarum]